jgi:hypothetical protein
MAPQPPVGIHRYVLVLFQQKSRIVDGYAAPPADHAYFNTRAFAANHELGLPVRRRRLLQLPEGALRHPPPPLIERAAANDTASCKHMLTGALLPAA